MTLYFCLDDRNGLGFNGRRQSRDAAVLADIQSRLDGELLIDPLSLAMVREAGIPCCIALPDLPPELPGCHYFVEQREPGGWIAGARQVVLYRWNRHYPADRWFTVDLEALGFRLQETGEFPGNSHEKITREVYAR